MTSVNYSRKEKTPALGTFLGVLFGGGVGGAWGFLPFLPLGGLEVGGFSGTQFLQILRALKQGKGSPVVEPGTARLWGSGSGNGGVGWG